MRSRAKIKGIALGYDLESGGAGWLASSKGFATGPGKGVLVDFDAGALLFAN